MREPEESSRKGPRSFACNQPSRLAADRARVCSDDVAARLCADRAAARRVPVAGRASDEHTRPVVRAVVWAVATAATAAAVEAAAVPGE